MRTLLAIAALVAAAVVPSAPRAQPAFGLRVGWGPGIGGIAAHVDELEAMRSQIPLQLDALWRFEERFGTLSTGAYASYGLGLSARCDPSAECSASVFRTGLEATVARAIAEVAEAWVGLGVGYEWANHRRTRSGSEVSTTYRGWELLTLEGGADLRVAPRLAVGPWAQLSVGRYADVHVSTSIDSASAPIGDRATHAWIFVGVRARVDL